METNDTLRFTDNATVAYDVETSEYYRQLMHTSEVIERFYIWVIFILGFPGNSVTIVTIVRMKPVTSLTCYVALLAIVDNLTLIIKLTHLILQHYNFRIVTSAECKTLIFLGNVLVNYASWILVAITMERFAAVWFPLKLGVNWAIKKSVVAMTMLLVVLVGIHLHLMWTLTSYYGNCEISEDYHNYFMSEVWYWISAIIYAFLPCLLLFIFNILIIYGIRKSADEHKHLTVIPSTRTHRDVTIMLVIVSIVFLILTTPICVFLLLGQSWLPKVYSDDFARKVLFKQIAYVFCDSNHAINFFLYFMSARRFRRQIFRCGKSSSPETVLLRNRSYLYTNRCATPATHVYDDTESTSHFRFYHKS